MISEFIIDGAYHEGIFYEVLIKAEVLIIVVLVVVVVVFISRLKLCQVYCH